MTATPQESAEHHSVGPNDILRFVLEVFAIVSLGSWGSLVWPLPWNIAIGLGAPALAILLWALFRSPQAVLRVDPFAKALVELVVMGASAFAWLGLGQPIVAGAFALIATVSGVINGRRDFR
ncbi:4-amino-4-deoxy-L-arabinose transferase [Leifsonia xyli subsp. xyli]|uniref:4-amino-4-deoxy-L-arabinose transferase n=2 Tax=Leifsonia xyli subsp. xyli TaxID=59736 RepID=Q6AD83_LEIXX|nr:YrdB family protein [Leifsonia xyli]AAT89661.1 conserved hypothetical protein [Leifsonia xyli subsp. xyli str. CTCB07]ODA91233.1 4-amino-4-deoxy-L-arabinose transferase [Leifsonia xyli subsp. xyli]